MKPLTVGDALTHDTVVRVHCGEKPPEIAKQGGTPIYAVFSSDVGDADTGEFLGIVTLDEVRRFPHRLFADLVRLVDPPYFTPDVPLASAIEELNRANLPGAPVVDPEGNFLGVLTRESWRDLLLKREQELLAESEALRGELEAKNRQLSRYAEKLLRLNACGLRLIQLMGQCSLEDEFLREALDAVRSLTGALYAALAFVDADGRIERFLYSGIDEETARQIGRLPEGKGLLGLSLRQGEILKVEDISKHPQSVGFPEHHPAMCSLVAVPFYVDEVVHGHVYVCNEREGEAFSEDDEAILQSFAQLISLMLANRRAEEKRKLLEQQYYQAQKMEAIGQLAAGVAHNFNNLLTVISGNAELLMYVLPPEGQHRQLLQHVKDAAMTAADIARQLLIFSRKKVITPEVIDLAHLVPKAEKMFSRLLTERYRLEIHVPDTCYPIIADPGQIEQVLLNLIVNARDAMPEGGNIRISVHHETLSANQGRGGAPAVDGSYAVVTVSDNGCGMDPETLERIFEPFFTTKELGKGTGLGLATVAAIVDQHRGFIQVESQPGKGTTFRIYFPQATEMRDVVRQEVAPLPSGSGQRIVLAEDEADVREVAYQILKSADYEVLLADSGEKALELIQHSPTPIDLVVTDVIMPGMTGVQLQEELAERGLRIPVVLMSGYSDAVSKEKIEEEGMYFLSKPFSRSSLLRILQRALSSQVPS